MWVPTRLERVTQGTPDLVNHSSHLTTTVGTKSVEACIYHTTGEEKAAQTAHNRPSTTELEAAHQRTIQKKLACEMPQ